MSGVEGGFLTALFAYHLHESPADEHAGNAGSTGAGLAGGRPNRLLITLITFYCQANTRDSLRHLPFAEGYRLKSSAKRATNKGRDKISLY
ncbi:unnamed protein product [Colias eurytheme]|nr:unnamed protein product [Colias eurytheme]